MKAIVLTPSTRIWLCRMDNSDHYICVSDPKDIPASCGGVIRYEISRPRKETVTSNVTDLEGGRQP